MRKLVMLAALGGLVLMFSLCSAPKADATWYDSNWDYRAPIQIDNTYVENENFVNYPMLVTITLDNAKTMDNGDDILFCDNTGDIKIPHEIEGFDGVNLIAWVLIPHLYESENTLVYVYYGNDGVTNQENIENVWDENYQMVLHMVDNTTSTLEDSTSNALHVTKTGANEPIENSSGYIFNAQTFDGSDDYGYTGATYTAAINEEVTIEMWVYPESTCVNYNTMFGYFGGDIFNGGIMAGKTGGDNPNTWATYDAGVNYKYGSAHGQDAWFHIVWVYDGTNARLYVDGEIDIADYATNYAADTGAMVIGRWYIGNDDYYFPGNIDEVRMSNIARNENWVYTAFLIENDPTGATTMGIEESLPALFVSNATVDNALIDRDQDIPGSSVVLATQVSVQVKQGTAGENADSLTDNVHIWIWDANSNLVVDTAAPIDNTPIDENTISFLFQIYNPPDVMVDASLGFFRVYVEATDNASTFDNSNNTTAFVVDDVDGAIALTQDNLPGHTHKMSGTAARETGGAAVLDNAIRVDTNDGRADAYLTGTAFDNTYTPTAVGYVWFEIEMNSALDGFSENFNYTSAFPNIPSTVTVTVDNALIDNNATDNAPEITRITAIFEDNDGFGDFIADFWLACRDDDVPSLVDNENVTSTVVYSDENLATVYWDFDAGENDFTAAEMGTFDVWYYASDNWGNTADWDIDTFVVDDIYVPTGLAPDNTTIGFAFGYNVLATGTFTRMSGIAASINAATLVDSAEGTIDMGAGNAYAENYTIVNSSPGDLVTVTIYAWDDVLDGENENTYLVNENRRYTWNVLAEDNHLAPYNFFPSRTYTLSWYFWPHVGEMGREENVTAATGFSVLDFEVRNVVLSDNGLYWRSSIPENYADNLIFYLLQENSNRDITYQYTYTLEDYTGDFMPEDNGSLWIERLVDNITITVNSDYWDGDLTCPAWLLYNIRHQYTVRNEAGTERTVAFFTTDLDYDREVPVRPLSPENIIFVWDVVSVAVWRDEVSVWVAYDDTGENTENVTVTIYPYGETTAVYSTTSTSDSFVLEWNAGENNLSYEVVIEVYREVADFDHFVQERAVGPNLTGYIIPDPEGADFLGGPVPMLALVSNMIVALAALAFSARFDVQGMFAITFVAAGLKLVGWLPIDWALIGILLALSFFWMLGKGER